MEAKSCTAEKKGESSALSRASSLDSLAVAGIALITLAIFSNTVAWSLQATWQVSGDLCHSSWNHLLDIVGDDEFNLWIWGTLIYSIVFYWIVGGIFIVLDLTTWLTKYKVQPVWNEPVDKKKLGKAVCWVLFNQLVVSSSSLYAHYYVIKYRGAPPVRELPSLPWLLVCMLVYVLLEEVGFYYSHRLMHTRLLYRHIHKRHHEWTAPTAIVAIYCHPVEHFISNMLTPLFASTLLGSHLCTMWIVITIFQFNTLCVHSGYHLPLLPSPESHDFHHLKFNQCYGVLGILDSFHQTDTLFVSSGVSARHKVLTSLTPIRDLVEIKNTAAIKHVK